MTDKIVSAAGRYAALAGAMFAVVIPLLTIVIYFARIDPSISELNSKVADERASVIELKVNVQREQTDQNARVDRIEESRREGLQRLAKVEEATISIKDSLREIKELLNRPLFGTGRSPGFTP